MALRGCSRREFLRLGGLGLASVGLAACAAPAIPGVGGSPKAPAAKTLTPVKVGHLTRQLGNVVSLYPEVGPEHGVDFEVVLFQDGAAVLQALSTGDILLGAPTKVQLVQAMQRGVDLTMVMGYAGGYVALLSSKESPVTPGDWAGVQATAEEKRARGESFQIGVPTGSLQHIVLLHELQSAGIDPDRDVELINVPFAEHVRVLEAGQVDMAGAVALFAGVALLEDRANLFKHAVDTPLRRFEVGFVTTRRLAQERPDEIQAIVDAHYAAMQNVMNDPTRGAAREVAYTELPEAVVRRSYEFLEFDYRVDVEAIRATERAMRAIGLHEEDLSDRIPDYVDLSFLARASGTSVEEVGTW